MAKRFIIIINIIIIIIIIIYLFIYLFFFFFFFFLGGGCELTADRYVGAIYPECIIVYYQAERKQFAPSEHTTLELRFTILMSFMTMSAQLERSYNCSCGSGTAQENMAEYTGLINRELLTKSQQKQKKKKAYAYLCDILYIGLLL